MPKPINPIKTIDSYYDRCLVLIGKEITHLESLLIVKKLSQSAAKDLRDIIKLLAGMKDAHTSILAKRKSDAEAKAKAMSASQIEEALKGKS